MKMAGSHGTLSLSAEIKCSECTIRRRTGCLASRAFQEPSILIHPTGVVRPHPRWRRFFVQAFSEDTISPAADKFMAVDASLRHRATRVNRNVHFVFARIQDYETCARKAHAIMIQRRKLQMGERGLQSRSVKQEYNRGGF